MTKIKNQNLKFIAEQAVEWLLVLEKDTKNQPEQRELFLNWLKMSPLHIEEFLFASNLIHNIKNANANEFIELAIKIKNKDNVIKLSDHVHDDFDKPIEYEKKGPKIFGFFAIAAVFALFVLGVFLLISPPKIDGSNIYITKTGEQRSILLEDGTLVNMNTQTKIKLDFSKQFRRVELIQGEAVFNVAKDIKRPFRVYSGFAVAEAIGTSFNVYREDKITTITVVEGKVGVFNHLDNKHYPTLTQGEQITVNHTSKVAEVKRVNTDQAMSWTTRRLIFEKESLEKIVNEINRYSHRKIIINDPILKQKNISGVFGVNDPKALLIFLTKVGNINVQELNENKGWLLTLEDN